MKFFILLCVISSANAGVILEPYLSATLSGKGSSTITTGSTTREFTHSFNGLGYGGRLGYSFFLLMLGLDYSQETFSLDSTATGFEASDDMSKSQTGIFIGAKLAFLRVWTTFFFNAEANGEGAAISGSQAFSNTSKFSDGSGFGLGLGYSLLPFVSLNFEYRTLEYKSYTLNGVDTGSNYAKKLNLDSVLLSVSLPVDI